MTMGSSSRTMAPRSSVPKPSASSSWQRSPLNVIPTITASTSAIPKVGCCFVSACADPQLLRSSVTPRGQIRWRLRPRSQRRVGRDECGDVAAVAEREIEIVPAVQELHPPDRVDLERDDVVAGADALGFEVDRDLLGAVLEGGDQLVGRSFRHPGRQEAVVDRVRREDVAEARRDDAAHAVIDERVYGRFARRAGAEIPPGDKDAGARPRRPVERKLRPRLPCGVEPHVVEQHRPVLLGAGPLQEARRQDLVRVDVRERDRTGDAGDVTQRLHQTLPAISGRTSTRWPATAAAATIAGDMRWVRAPGPWRPLKLRFVVEAQRSPLGTWSPLMPTHIEHPLSTHSSPASLKMRSTRMSVRRWPRARFMYASASRICSALPGSAARAGSGTTPSIGRASSGLTPHVTTGAMSAPSSETSRSKAASASLARASQSAAARSNASPAGANGRPRR